MENHNISESEKLALANSIREYGYDDNVPAILYDHTLREIKSGVYRLNACLKLKINPPIVDAMGRHYKIVFTDEPYLELMDGEVHYSEDRKFDLMGLGK